MNIVERATLFIDSAIKTHGDKYDYSHVEYVNSATKVAIMCNKCKQTFYQTPASHISVQHPCGCPFCRYERRRSAKPYTTLTSHAFIEKANAIHTKRYTYENVHYVNSKTKVAITCCTHGDFMQTPNGHLSGTGCPVCELEAKRVRNRERCVLSTEEFVRRARALYGDAYDYSDTVYVSSDKPVHIECTMHGVFIVKRAEKHLRGQQCPSCIKTGSAGEKLIMSTLDALGVQYYRQQRFEDCSSPTSGRALPFDFYVPSYNLLIEFDGEQHTRKSPLFHKGDRFERMQQHDTIKTEYATKNGFRFVRISFTEIRELESIITTQTVRP